jgi:hypothetical protein
VFIISSFPKEMLAWAGQKARMQGAQLFQILNFRLQIEKSATGIPEFLIGRRRFRNYARRSLPSFVPQGGTKEGCSMPYADLSSYPK